jgi:predicted O-methyltransferase YrrM
LGQLSAELPYPYNTLKEVLPFNGHGMYINAVPMEKLIKELNPKIVIELGCWLGKSTRHIASIIPLDGVVFAVDHWLGSSEHQDSSDLPALYEQFLSNVVHANLTEKIIPIKLTTLDAVEGFYKNKIVPDLVYVDASHDEASVYADLQAYFPLVKGHGVLCGDDWGWGGALGFPVCKAVHRFAVENGLTVDLFEGWFWVLREQ